METEQVTIQRLKQVLAQALLEERQTVENHLNLGLAYYERYQHTQQQDNLENAIMCYNEGLQVDSVDKDLDGLLLNYLGIALWDRYKKVGITEDLEKAVACQKQALDLSPLGHSSRAIFLNNLAAVLQTRYETLGEMKDLEDAITLNEQALSLRPPGHPLRSSSLNNLANALETGYAQFGRAKDLEKAITCFEEALSLRPPGHPSRLMSLNNLANALEAKFKQFGDIQDLNKAIFWNEQALTLSPPDHPLRSMSLNNLANSLQTRYEQHADMEDLERALRYHKLAMDLHPPGHPDRTISLNNLADAYLIRYKEFGEMKDLDTTILYHEQALELYSPNSPFKSTSLNNLANALENKYKQYGVIRDLEKAIIYHEQALDLHPDSGPLKSMYLNNLANALQTRYERLAEANDLEQAMTCIKQALNLCPPGHPLRPSHINSLISALFNQYKHLGDMRDLEDSLDFSKQALILCPPGHPLRSMILNNFGLCFYSKYEKLKNRRDLEEALASHQEAASHTMSSLPDRLVAAKLWATRAHRHGFSSAISAYSHALGLLQQHLALLPSLTSQQKLVEKSSQLSLDAAACAISADAPEIALQVLEQGRSILWSKIQGYRQSLELISNKAPQLAIEFKAVSKQLEDIAIARDTDLTLQHVLSNKWITLLGNIRSLDGFSNYLMDTPFKVLQKAASEGPVIMLNISSFRSDALILFSHGSPVVISLPYASPKVLKQLVGQLSSATISSDPSKAVLYVLQHLWHTVVKPVVEQLKQLKVPKKSHIWWCPTSYLCALPLHAAGPYKKGLRNLPDLYISSYTPTLESLIKARSNVPQSMFNLLIVSQPDSTIPHVFEEIKVIKDFQKMVDLFSGQDADKQSVLAALQTHSWVHFACHGHLEDQPFHSWFQLYKGECLTVLDLAQGQLPNAEFAFLSACHSAAGSPYGTPDESIHLAGALHFSGFRGVVGTLWAMVDDDGPSIATAFYKYMFRNPNNVDLKDAAYALNHATRELRKQCVPLDRWINFIHIGA